MSNRDLDHWLWIATKGLAPQIAARVREEITAHYEAELEHQLDDGADDLHAHRLALEALGDPESVARGMVEPHRSEQDYLHASKLALAAPLTAIGAFLLLLFWQPLGFQSSMSPAFVLLVGGLCAAFVGCTVHSLRTLRRLLVRRFAMEEATLPLRLIEGGLWAVTAFFGVAHAFVFLFSWIGQEQLTALLENLALLTTLQWLSAVLTATLFLGGAAVGSGLALLALRLSRLWSELYDLRGALRMVTGGAGSLTLALVGLVMFDRFTGMTITLATPFSLLLVMALISHLLVYPTLARLFRRAAYFDTPHKQKRQTE